MVRATDCPIMTSDPLFLLPYATILRLPISCFKLLAFFCDCAGHFVSDMVQTPKDQLSHIAAHFEFSYLAAPAQCDIRYCEQSTSTCGAKEKGG